MSRKGSSGFTGGGGSAPNYTTTVEHPTKFRTITKYTAETDKDAIAVAETASFNLQEDYDVGKKMDPKNYHPSDMVHFSSESLNIKSKESGEYVGIQVETRTLRDGSKVYALQLGGAHDVNDKLGLVKYKNGKSNTKSGFIVGSKSEGEKIARQLAVGKFQ